MCELAHAIEAANPAGNSVGVNQPWNLFPFLQKEEEDENNYIFISFTPFKNVAMSWVPVLLSPLKKIIAQWFLLITKTVNWKDHTVVITFVHTLMFRHSTNKLRKISLRGIPFHVVSITHLGNWRLARLYYIANRSIHCIVVGQWLISSAFHPHSQLAIVFFN